MKKHFLLLSTFFVTFFTYSMDQITFKTSAPIKHKLNEALQRFQQLQKLSDCYSQNVNYFPSKKNLSDPYIEEPFNPSHNYNHEVAQIALTAGDEMCNLKKLKYLRGDFYYENRKKIICNIINNIKVENFDPCTICYYTDNPLIESIVQKDVEFTKYLLRSGAKPSEKEIQKLKRFPSSEIAELFMLFESDTSKTYELVGIQYKKNNFGNIFPLWQHIPQEELLSKLSQFVSYLDMIKGTPCIIEVPHSKVAVLDIIKKIGFTLHYTNNDKTEWIFKNNS